MPDSTPLLRVRDLDKAYDQAFSRVFVLRGVDLDVEAGEFVSVMGPSGSGKSTLLHILGMLDEPSSGEYYFDGQPVHRMRERQRTELHRTRIGFVFQAYHLLDDLTVYENLETPLLYQKVPKAERQGRIAEMLDRFGMVAKQDLFPSQLSGGQQQLVGVARALIIRPQLILADEPTGNLHSGQGDEVMEAFRELNEQDGVTIVQVTHSEHAASYGSRTIELLDGQVVSDERTAKATA